jgi:chaperonin GroES
MYDMTDPNASPDAQGEAMSPAMLKLKELADQKNIAATLDAEKLGELADLVVTEYEIDRDSMADWKKRMELGLKLASLEKEARNYPWAKSANVKYPLVTNAVLMFNAKAYPAIVQGDEVVKASVHGADFDGSKAARAERVSAHMSWQLTSKVTEWEEETDKLLTLLPLVGTLFRKTWYDPAWKRIRCRNILPGKLVVNSRVTSLQDAPRCTEEISKYPSEIAEKVRAKEWLSHEYHDADNNDTAAPEDFLEQHRRIDLDGDGYSEPYIVTVHEKSRKVARIVPDYVPDEDVTLDDKGEIASIQRGQYFTAFHFLPSMDGSFHSTGFGLLLGDISETINTILNQMIDAGHMASMGGGFIGSDFRIKGGSNRFRPGEWKTPGASGSVIKDSIVPLTWPGPDKTLFELLGLLIEAGKEVANVKDVLTGEAGKGSKTAFEVQAMVEQGMSQYTATFKRIWRSLKQEYALIARINRDTVSSEEYNRFHDETEPAPMPPQGQTGAPVEGMPQGAAPPEAPPGAPPMQPEAMQAPQQPKIYDPKIDYDLTDMDITPVADPNTATKMQMSAKAQILLEMAKEGMVNPQEASKRALEAASIEDTEELLPKPDPMQQQMMQLELALKDAEGKLKNAQAMLAEAQAQQLGMTAQVEMAKAEGAHSKAQADAMKSQAELQGKMVEHQNAQGEMQLKSREIDAKVALIAAQIEKIHAEITQGAAEIQIKGQQTEIAGRKTDADIQRGSEEVDIARQNTAITGKKTDADIAHKGAEIELGAHKQQTEAQLKARELDHAAEQGKVVAKKTDADIANNVAKTKIDGKRASIEAKAAIGEDPDEPPKKKVTRTKVTKHDDKGRILEFVQESD